MFDSWSRFLGPHIDTGGNSSVLPKIREGEIIIVTFQRRNYPIPKNRRDGVRYVIPFLEPKISEERDRTAATGHFLRYDMCNSVAVIYGCQRSAMINELWKGICKCERRQVDNQQVSSYCVFLSMHTRRHSHSSKSSFLRGFASFYTFPVGLPGVLPSNSPRIHEE